MSENEKLCTGVVPGLQRLQEAHFGADGVASRDTVATSIVRDSVRLALSGRLVLGDNSISVLREAILRCTGQPSLIVVDLSALTKIDCAGIGSLVFAYTEAQRVGVRVVLANEPPFLIDLLALLRLDKVFDSFAPRLIVR